MIRKEVLEREYTSFAGTEIYKYYKDTDYTGRWKVSKGSLYIECFEINNEDRRVERKLCRQVPVYDTIWRRIIRIPSSYRYDCDVVVTYEDKVYASVRWVHEDLLKSYTETINTCSEVCNEADT